MFFRMVLFIWGFVLDVVAVSRLTEDEKDLEILLLRQQLRIVERKQERGPRIPRWKKIPLAVVAYRLKQKTSHSRQALEDSIRLFKPATVIGWHREAVRRKWTYQQKRQPGRPPIDAELEQWILRVAQDNPGLGYDKLEGELLASEPDHDSYGTSSTWHSSSTRTVTAGKLLAHLSQSLQGAISGVRLSDGGNPYPPDVICLVFHRTRNTTSLPGRLHGSSRCGVGHPTSPSDDLGAA